VAGRKRHILVDTLGLLMAVVVRLGVPQTRVLPEVYRLRKALSPHRAAELDGVTINPARLVPPDVWPLIIELAGGLMVPLSRELLQIDVVARWKLQVILVARTGLGTINHTLLSLEALRTRGIEVHGVAFVGDENKDNERTVCEIGSVRRLGRLALVEVRADTLAAAFRAGFRLEDFA
jgi:dethiobiotin synthetase